MRKITLGLVATAAIAAPIAFASAATAAPAASLSGLPLTGEDTCGFKTVYGAAQTPYLFGPVQLIGEDFTPTGKWLFPYEVTIISGEGLKARHLLPGVTHTRPGLQPTNLVTCDFTGTTRELGDFEVQITGAIRGQ